MKKTTWLPPLCSLALLFASLTLNAAPPSAPGSAGGIADPLKIRQVKMIFGYGDVGQSRKTFTADQPIAGFGATIYYTGAGTLIGRWEVVRPGEASPSALHTMVEYEVPNLERGSLTRYKVVDTFIESLPATGRHFLTGPDPAKLPRDLPGIYRVLLRIESVSSVTIRNPPQPGLSIPVLQYTIQGVRPVEEKKLSQ
jgi:hypothetical protein